MAELKLNEYQIDFAQQQLRRCRNKVEGAIDALFWVRYNVFVFFKSKIEKVEDDYRCLFNELSKFQIQDYSEGEVEKHALIYNDIKITSDTEYERCMKEYKIKINNLQLDRNRFNFIKFDISQLLEALEAATNEQKDDVAEEESEKYCDTETILCYTKEKGFYFGAATKLEENKEE